MPGIGFKTKLSVNDGVANADTPFDDLTTVTLPGQEWGEFESTTLAQVDGSGNPDYTRKYLPTLLELETLKADMFMSTDNRKRCLALLANPFTKKTFILKTPDPDGGGSGNPQVGLKVTLVGWMKKIGEVKFERMAEMNFPIEIRIDSILVENNANDPAPA